MKVGDTYKCANPLCKFDGVVTFNGGMKIYCCNECSEDYQRLVKKELSVRLHEKRKLLRLEIRKEIEDGLLTRELIEDKRL